MCRTLLIKVSLQIDIHCALHLHTSPYRLLTKVEVGNRVSQFYVYKYFRIPCGMYI